MATVGLLTCVKMHLAYYFCLSIHFAGLQVFLATLTHADPMMALVPSLCQPHDIPDIKMDTAHLTIDNDGQLPPTLVLYTQSKECYEVSNFFLWNYCCMFCNDILI